MSGIELVFVGLAYMVVSVEGVPQLKAPKLSDINLPSRVSALLALALEVMTGFTQTNISVHHSGPYS